LHKYRKVDNSISVSDSINFLLGWINYSLKDLDSSTYYFNKVSPYSESFHKSRYYTGFNYMYLGKLNQARNHLRNIQSTNDLLKDMADLQNAGIHLIEHKYDSFKMMSNSFTFDHFQLAKEQKSLMNHYNEMIHFKEKSMFMAGFLSAIIPGLGKVYIGKYGEAASLFFITGSLGVITAENYIKNGIKDYRTLIAAGLLSTVYIGNIWGSAVSVKIKQNEFYHQKEHQILLDIHIALRNIFY